MIYSQNDCIREEVWEISQINRVKIHVNLFIPIDCRTLSRKDTHNDELMVIDAVKYVNGK